MNHLEDHLAADPSVQKAQTKLNQARDAERAAQERYGAALLAEADGVAGSSTAAATARRALAAAADDLQAAERALSLVRERAHARAEESLRAAMKKQWAGIEKIAAKRVALAEKLSGTLAELAAGYREFIALDQELAKAPNDAAGARARLGADAVWKAIALQAVREGMPATSWPWGATQAPTLRSHAEDSAATLLAGRPL